MPQATASRRAFDPDAYSLSRAVESAASSLRREKAPDGYEAEVSASLETTATLGRRGFNVPLSALTPPGRKLRALDLTSGAGAVQTKLAPGDAWSDVLRRKSVAGLLGVRFVHMFEGGLPVNIPTKTTGATAGWIGDGSGVTPSTPDWDATSEGPKTVGAAVIVTRKMRNMAGPAFDDYLAAELSASLAAELDRAIVAGAGTNEPVGLLNQPGVPTLAIGANGGAPTRAHLIAMEKTVGVANGDAAASASLGWVSSPEGRAKLRSTDGSTGNAGAWLWSDADRILSHAAFATTSVPANLTKGSGTNLTALAYGDWADVVVNLPESIRVIVDPFSRSTSGDVRVVAFLDVRVVFRHLASFVVCKDMATS